MKRRMLLILSLTICFINILAAAEFGYPVGGEPWYFIKASFSDAASLSKGAWRVSGIAVNGSEVRDFLLCQGGQEVLGKDIRGQLPFEVKARVSWQANQSYEVQVQLENTKTRKTATLRQNISSPSLKGYWDPGWENYLALVIAEENGIERPDYPVQATIGVLSNYLKSGDEIRVVKAERSGDDVAYAEIPSRVYDSITWSDPEVLAIEEKDEKTGNGSRSITRKRVSPSPTSTSTWL